MQYIGRLFFVGIDFLWATEKNCNIEVSMHPFSTVLQNSPMGGGLLVGGATISYRHLGHYQPRVANNETPDV